VTGVNSRRNGRRRDGAPRRAAGEALEPLYRDGRALLLWKPAPRGPRREGLLCFLWMCRNPECPGRHLYIEAFAIDERFKDFTREGTTLSIEFVGSEAERPMPSGRVFAGIDIDSGAVFVPDDARSEERLLKWLKEAVQGEVLALLRARWRDERARTGRQVR
jgi:hypothetical protein